MIFLVFYFSFLAMVAYGIYRVEYTQSNDCEYGPAFRPNAPEITCYEVSPVQITRTEYVPVEQQPKPLSDDLLPPPRGYAGRYEPHGGSDY